MLFRSNEEVVLVIRGELLKRYPNAVIYAHKAKWQLNADGTIDNSQERILEPLSETEVANPPKDKFQMPLYEAKAEPDIYFFGFDLDIEEVKGTTGENPGDENKPGWFFCIKERPGEPRFGLDIEVPADVAKKPAVWNDLAWDDLLPGAPAGSHIPANDAVATIVLAQLQADEEEKEEQRKDDVHVSWNKDMNAADMAYVLYQVPVLVAVHGSEKIGRAHV